MADVITRFKLETTQYDSKLRDESKWLAEYTRQATLAGKEFGKFTQKNVEAARALGSITPSATNAKDKVKELVASFNDAASAYNALTKEQQQGDFGKAMAESIGKLKDQLREAKQELYGTGGVLDVLKDKFTVNIDAVKLFNVGMSAARAALDVAKDAFFNNEEQLDEWGRVVESSHSLYQGFLNALNTGDISGYLNNINKIVQAARDAYDALDALGTYNAFNQINVEKTRTGMTESIAAYRGGTGSKDAVKAAGEAYKKELQDRKRLENEAYLAAVKRMASEHDINAKDLQDALSGTYGHYQDLKNVQPTGVRQTVVGSGMFARTGTETFAQTRQEKLGEALRHLNDTELQSLQALGAQAQRTGNEIAQVDKQLTRVLNGKQPGTTGGGKGGKTTTVKEDKDDFEEIVGLIPNAEEAVKSLQQQIRESWDEGEIASLTKDLEKAEAELQRLKAIGKEAKPKEMVQGLSGFNAQTMSAWMSGRQSDLSKAEYGSADYSGIMANIADMNAIKTVLEQSMKAGIDAAQFDLEPLWEKVFDGENISDDTWQSMVDVINEKLKELNLEPIQLDFQTGNVKSQAKEMAKDWQAAGTAIQAVGSAMSQIEDPAAKVVGTIAQAIASVALGYAQATTQAASMGPWAWIAFAATGLATMISTIAAIHSATGYANGGVVKGSSYSGDNIPALVDGSELVGLNAGEIVLTAAQAGNVAQNLQGSNRNVRVTGHIAGHDLVLAVDRTLSIEGKGHLVSFKG